MTNTEISLPYFSFFFFEMKKKNVEKSWTSARARCQSPAPNENKQKDAHYTIRSFYFEKKKKTVRLLP